MKAEALAMLDRISFPALFVPRGFGFSLAMNPKRLTTTTRSGWKKGKHFDGTRIIDSKGLLFEMMGAQKPSHAGFVWSVRYWLGQQVEVEPIFGPQPIPISMTQTMEIFAHEMERHWDAYAEVMPCNLDEFLETARQAKSVKELIEIFESAGYE